MWDKDFPTSWELVHIYKVQFFQLSNVGEKDLSAFQVLASYTNPSFSFHNFLHYQA